MPNGERGSSTPAIPRALRLVALLFAAAGLFNVAEMAANLAAGRASIELGIINFWVAGGLLRLDRKWLTWGKRFIWFDLIVVDLLTLLGAFTDTKAKFRFGSFSAEISDTQLLLHIMAVAAVALWQLRVLNRPEIEALFREDVPAPPSRRFAPKPDLAIPEPAFDSSALAGRPRDANTRWQTKLDPEIREAAPLPASRPGDPRNT